MGELALKNVNFLGLYHNMLDYIQSRKLGSIVGCYKVNLGTAILISRRLVLLGVVADRENVIMLAIIAKQS